MSDRPEPYVGAVWVTVPAGARVALAAVVDERLGRLELGWTGHTIELPVDCLEVIWNELPGVLSTLHVLGGADERTDEIDGRPSALAAYLRDQAEAADAAGKPERAAELREAADKVTASVEALELALRAVSAAADVVDGATEHGERLLKEEIAESAGGAA